MELKNQVTEHPFYQTSDLKPCIIFNTIFMFCQTEGYGGIVSFKGTLSKIKISKTTFYGCNSYDGNIWAEYAQNMTLNKICSVESKTKNSLFYFKYSITKVNYFSAYYIEQEPESEYMLSFNTGVYIFSNMNISYSNLMKETCIYHSVNAFNLTFSWSYFDIKKSSFFKAESTKCLYKNDFIIGNDNVCLFSLLNSKFKFYNTYFIKICKNNNEKIIKADNKTNVSLIDCFIDSSLLDSSFEIKNVHPVNNFTITAYFETDYTDIKNSNINEAKKMKVSKLSKEHINVINMFNVEVSNSVFDSIEFYSIGGAIYSSNPLNFLTISDCSFIKCNALYSGCFYIKSANIFNISNVCFERCSALENSIFYVYSHHYDFKTATLINSPGERYSCSLFKLNSDTKDEKEVSKLNFTMNNMAIGYESSYLFNLPQNAKLSFSSAIDCSSHYLSFDSIILMNFNTYKSIFNKFAPLESSIYVSNCKIKNTTIYKLSNKHIFADCLTNEENLKGVEGITFTKDIVIEKNNQKCFYFEDLQNNTVIIITSVTIVVVIVALSLFLYTFFTSKKLKKHEEEKELSMSIFNDFG